MSSGDADRIVPAGQTELERRTAMETAVARATETGHAVLVQF